MIKVFLFPTVLELFNAFESCAFFATPRNFLIYVFLTNYKNIRLREGMNLSTNKQW